MASDSWQPGEMSWSFSRKNHFDSCRRHYFYSRFWSQETNPQRKWMLCDMKNISTLSMFRGHVVHQVIAGALNSVRMGAPISEQEARQAITAGLREGYMQSKKRVWHIDNRPQGTRGSDYTNLLEHYYNLPNTEERARHQQRIAWSSVSNLVESDFWRRVSGSEPAGWMTIEEGGFPSFDLDGIKVYATLDFALSASGQPTVIDWKTGARNPGDRQQLALYSLYARAKWDWDPTQTDLVLVYLQPALEVDSFRPTAEELEAAKNEVRLSFEQMMELEPAFGPADPEMFPMTEDRRGCCWCRFQGACGAVKDYGIPPDSVEPGDEVV